MRSLLLMYHYQERDNQIVEQFEEAENVCDKHVKGCKCGVSYGGIHWCSTGGNNKRSKKKYALFSISGWSLNQHCMENLSC
jgi:hypothetical protein